MLRLWLERAYFGRETLGIESAAHAYFGKSSSELDSNQSARLAALLRAPGLRNQPERWTERARVIQNRVAALAH
jgi:membrane peptidoglycan carboxypeptidase